MYHSVPDLIMKLLIITKVLDLEGFVDDQILNIVLSILITSLNIISESYQIYSAAQTLQEDTLTYGLLCMKAKQGWVPFAHKI